MSSQCGRCAFSGFFYKGTNPSHWASQVALVVKNLLLMLELQKTWVRSLGWEDSPGGGHGNPLQYSGLENPMDREIWKATVHGVTLDTT